jgi:hypothetical protein
VNQLAVVSAIARADFLERVRRYSFLFTIGLALYFGYLAIIDSISLRLGEMRGIFNSAWVGSLLTVVGSTLFSLAGFYLVKNSMQRDCEIGVGQILAATPLSKTLYIFGKALSNFAVLSLMIAVLALSAVIMQLVRGEDSHVHLWTLLAPFLFLAVPVMAVVASTAVLFESIPYLRSGFGNVAYFVFWIACLSLLFASSQPVFDLTGIALIKDSAMAAAHLSPSSSFSFNIDPGQHFSPASTFRWDGLVWTPHIIFARLIWLALAVLLALLAVLFFDRFDPARSFRRPRPESSAAAPPLPAVSFSTLSTTAPVAHTLTPLLRSAAHSRFGSILGAELRLSLKGHRWWWYLVALGLAIACAVVPQPAARGMILACAWLWPVLIWSSLGTRETHFQTHHVIFSAPHPIARQLPAVWLSGVILALVTGSGFAVRLLLGGNLPGLFAWAIATLFIPSLALALGVWSGTGKLFEVLYTLLWYVGPMNAFPALDFMGSSPATASTRYPLLYLALAAILFLVAVAGRKRQLLA